MGGGCGSPYEIRGQRQNLRGRLAAQGFQSGQALSS